MQSIEQLIARFGVPYERAAAVKRILDNNKAHELPNFFDVALDREGANYYFIEELGRGARGSVYTASTTGSHVPSRVVKSFLTERAEPLAVEERVAEFGTEEAQFQVEYVEREFRMSIVIRRRLHPEYCEQEAVCALTRFYSADERNGYLVFPFTDSVSLGAYVALFIAPALHDFRRALADLKLPDATIPELLTIASDKKDRASGAVIDALVPFFDARQRCLVLGNQLLTAIGSLHTASIIHHDVKPANIVVELNGLQRLRLIDFGSACAFARPGDNTFDAYEQALLECEGLYLTTKNFEDPLAHTRPIIANKDKLREEFIKFESYSVGKTLQVLFDPDLLDEEGKQTGYPMVRITPLMPPGLSVIIEDMTSERGYLPPKANDVVFLRPAERERRERLFESRTTVVEAQASFLSQLLHMRHDADILERLVARRTRSDKK